MVLFQYIQIYNMRTYDYLWYQFEIQIVIGYRNI